MTKQTLLLADSTVMVVDDNHLMCKLMVRMLGELGCARIVAARNGAHAFDILRSDASPDVLIVDHDMPGMNGCELIRTIRGGISPVPRDTPIIMVTGHPEEWRIAEAREAGADDILVKPFTVETLALRLAACLE